MLDLDEVRAIQCEVGHDDDVRNVRCNVMCTPKTERTETLENLKEQVRQVLERVPQATFAVSNVPILEGLGDYPPIMLQVRGPDLDQLQEHAERIAEELEQIPGTSDVDVRHTPGMPELAVRLDRDRVRERGLSARDVALQTRLALHGEVAGKVRRERRNVEIRVMLSEAFRHDPDALEEMLIWGPEGPVPLGDIGEVEPRTGPVGIRHYNRMRQISVSSQVGERPLGEIVADIHARFDEMDWGDDYTLDFRGFQEDMVESNRSMGMALALAMVFIFIILASQFESLIHPLTIVISLPLGFLGAFLALLAWGSAISLPASLGIILLVGLCAKNGILLVDGALQRMRDHGLDAREAMRLAGPRRLRPILMTSAAMIFGMLPTALARESGSEFRFPMAVAVIGGVISNTILTLLVLPVLFVVMDRLGSFFRRLVRLEKKPS